MLFSDATANSPCSYGLVLWLATPWKTTITQHCYDSNRYDIASMDIERTFDAGIDGTGRSFGHVMALDVRVGVRQAMCGSVFGDDGFFGWCRLFKSLFLFWSRLRRDASCVCMCLVKTESVVMSCLIGVCGCVGCGQWRQWCLARNAAMVKSWSCLLWWSTRSCHRPRYGLGVLVVREVMSQIEVWTGVFGEIMVIWSGYEGSLNGEELGFATSVR